MAATTKVTAAVELADHLAHCLDCTAGSRADCEEGSELYMASLEAEPCAYIEPELAGPTSRAAVDQVELGGEA